MDNAEKEKIISRIKKLLALGMKDPDTPEAVSAMGKAKELMDKYDLGTIDMNEDGTMDEANVIRENIEFNNDSRNWEIQIMSAIKKAFHCDYLIIPSKYGNAGKHVLVGSKTDINFAGFLFKYVRIQIMKMCDKHGFKGHDKKTYCMGCAFTVDKLIKETFVEKKVTKETEVVEQNRHNALIVVKQDAVARKMKEMFPKTKPMRRMAPLKGSMDSYNQGRMDGNKVRLNRQLNNNYSEKIS